MATEKKTFTKVMTPEGTFVWPRLNEPDFKFKKDTGEFQCRLRVAREDVADLIADIEAQSQKAYDEALADLKQKLAEAKTGADKAKLKERIGKFEMASLPFKDDVDDEGEPNGFVILNFKMPHKVSWKDKSGKQVEKLLVPSIFDASGKHLKTPPAIWGGTTGHVAGELRPFAAPLMAGVSLRLTGVQIIKLQSGGTGPDAAALGFGKKDGYEGSDEDTSAPAGDAANGDAPGADDDF